MTRTKSPANEVRFKLNLLIITPSYPNQDDSFIAETFVKKQVVELKNYFERVIVISPVFQSFNLMRKDQLCKNYSYDNVDVYYPRCFYIPIFWLSKPLIDNRLNVISRLIKKKDIKFDLTHAHFTWPSGYIGVKLKEMFGKPVVLTIHENGDWFDREVGMDNPLVNKAWSEADVIIRVNKKDIPILKGYNEQVCSIPNGFSPGFHPIDIGSAREQLDLPIDKKIIFSLGNLIKRKGFNHLIDAMDKICRQKTDVLCYIGGAGPEKVRLQKQIEDLHLETKIFLLGSLPESHLNLWMNACNFFILPSLNEGNPTVMFEALGCGKPFIGTRVGGVPEVITSDEYGLLVEPANPEDLAEKIIFALDCEWDQKKILDHADQFTWENISKQISGVYERVLRGTPQ